MALAPPSGSDYFLADVFGMPTILWRVLERAGYPEPPVYVWNTAPRGGQLVTLVQLSIPALDVNSVWHGWELTATGLSPEGAARNAAMKVLRSIKKENPEALEYSAAGMFPNNDPADTDWFQEESNALNRGRDERRGSTCEAMSLMFATLQVLDERENEYNGAMTVADMRRSEVEKCRKERKKAISLLKRAQEDKGLAIQIAAKDRVKLTGWKAKWKRAKHLYSKTSEALEGVENARDAALTREASLQIEMDAASLRETALKTDLAVTRGELQHRTDHLNTLARDLQEASRQLTIAQNDRATCAQQLQELEANYANLREEYYRIYYTLYPYVPPSPPAGPSGGAPDDADDGADSSSSSRYFD
jgi:hypothetical protein